MANPCGAGHSGAKMAAAGALASLLPPLFLEARVHAGGGGGTNFGDLVTQLGLSMPAAKNVDVAIFARTSGVTFAVGIGSFVAYKLLHRLIRSNCLWATLEQLSPEEEKPATAAGTAERPIELTEGFYAVRLGGENELLRRLDECLSEFGPSKRAKNQRDGVAVVQVRQASALRQLFRRNQRIHGAGIAALEHCSSSGEDEPFLLNEMAMWRKDILFRNGVAIDSSSRRPNRTRKWANNRRDNHKDEDDDDDDEQSTLSFYSDLTSASRIAPNPRHADATSPHPPALPEQFPESDSPTIQAQNAPFGGRNSVGSSSSASTSSSSSTPKSASLHLNYYDNELCWENEFSTNSDCSTDIEMDQREDDDDEGLFVFREREGSLGGLSQLSAMKNLEQMFKRREWHESIGEEALDHGAENLLENALENLRVMDNLDPMNAVASASTSSMADLIRAKAEEAAQKEEVPMTEINVFDEANFPFTAYRIFVQNEKSDISSICGSPRHSGIFEKRLNLPLQRPSIESAASQGLWELTSASSEECTNSRSNFEKRCKGNDIGPAQAGGGGGLLSPLGPMVDSVISTNSSFASTSASAAPRRAEATTPVGGIMFDSAICTDFQSSADDEDWHENCLDHRQNEGNNDQTAATTRPRAKSGILRRYGDVDDGRPLSKISEQSTPIKQCRSPSAFAPPRPPSSVPGSEPSLEWF